MFSILISQYVDTFYVVSDRIFIQNCKAVAAMCLEVEKNMI
jgi:hypothetical protein